VFPSDIPINEISDVSSKCIQIKKIPQVATSELVAKKPVGLMMDSTPELLKRL